MKRPCVCIEHQPEPSGKGPEQRAQAPLVDLCLPPPFPQTGRTLALS